MGVLSPTPSQDFALHGVLGAAAPAAVAQTDPRSSQEFAADQAERRAQLALAQERARQWMLDYEARLRRRAEANRQLAKRRMHPIAQSVKRARQ